MAAVFFDIDKTLVATNTAIAIVRYYLGTGFFGISLIFWALVYKLLYAFDLVNPAKMMQKGLEPFIGRSRSEVQVELREVYELFIKNSFYAQALECIQAHIKHGDRVILLTSTSWDIAGPIANCLDLDYIASGAELENGCYTARMLKPIPYGEGKLVLAQQFCHTHQFRLEEAFFYTDSHSDLPLLLRVGHPICVNPDIRLRRKARQNGWRIMEFDEVVSCTHFKNM